ELKLALTGAYRDIYWRSGSLPYQALLDNASDLGFLRTDFSGMQSYSRGAHSSNTSGFSETWDKMYSGIGRCNNLLTNMSKAQEVVSEDVYNRIQAEALFLRAYYYSWLIQLYGDVPFVTALPADIDAAKVAKTPKAEIANALYADLDQAAAVLPPTWPNAERGHATKGTALALKARIALAIADYATAADAAKQVIDMNAYTLHPDYVELFTYAGENSNEILLSMPHLVGFVSTGIPRQQGPRNASGYSQLVPSQFIVDSYECIDGLPIDESPLYDPANPFANRDPRLDASIVRPQSLFATYVFETHPDSINTTRIVDGVATRVANQDVRNAFATFTGYLWRKFSAPEDMPANVDTGSLDFILMRYAEVLLIYAEAKIELNQIDQTVLDALNAIRARAYGVAVTATSEYPAVTTMDQAALRTILRRERKVELAQEGFRMTDIHRWNIAQYVMPGTLVGRPKGAYSQMTFVPEIDEHGHPHYTGAESLYRAVDSRQFQADRDNLWAIPQKDIDVNGNLIQNDNY
ncbi:MAG TPA: RagB/SusD family nutrient uptake outer membrane protein, partial [Chryseosolibacter sp.]|nr:RagB/SusD family nutrient uptake outer membrane protein [Chryseosolibacter sp.]